jgi:hypothetical protein
MKNIDFVNKLKDIANNYDTLYVRGCFGAPMTAANKKRYTSNHTYNKNSKRTAMINAATASTFGFDCVCLIKGVLWGWNGNKNRTYGGAVYGSNNVPDINADQMIEVCSNVSTDFSKIEVGEAVWMKGHIGVYIGDGLAVECTPQWKNNVQITACNCTKSGYNRRNWKKHGKLPYIEYLATDIKQETATKKEGVCNVEVKVLKKGAKGEPVKALQALLIGYGYQMKSGTKVYGIDGSFGAATDKAVRAYQKANGLEVDGSVGPATWRKLLGVG